MVGLDAIEEPVEQAEFGPARGHYTNFPSVHAIQSLRITCEVTIEGFEPAVDRLCAMERSRLGLVASPVHARSDLDPFAR